MDKLLKVLAIEKRHTCRISYEGNASSDGSASYETDSIVYIDNLLGLKRRVLGGETKRYFTSTDFMELWIKGIMSEIHELKEVPALHYPNNKVFVNVILSDLSWTGGNLRFVIEEKYSEDDPESEIYVVTYKVEVTEIEVD